MRALFTISLALFLLGGFSSLKAQDLGGMMNQLVDGIKPEAFKGKFANNLDDWKSKTAGLKTDDLAGVKDQFGGLLKGLKGSALSGAAKGELLKGLAGLNGSDGIGKLISSLVSGLNPSMLTDSFLKNKDGFMKGLDMLK